MRKLLIIDDDPLVSARLGMIAESLGWDVDYGYALADIGNYSPDVILLDSLLPDGSGIEVGRALADAGTRLIFVSGAADEHNLRLMWEIAPVISKPLGIHSRAQLGRLLSTFAWG